MTCHGCTARDAHIAQLTALLADQNREILGLARDAAGLSNRAVPAPEPVAPLPELVETWLDLRFNRNTGLWRQQRAAARKLLAEGREPEEVTEILHRGAQIEL